MRTHANTDGLQTSAEMTGRNPSGMTFRLAVEACPNGMVMFNGHGDMVFVNNEIAKQFGYRREELIGRPVDMLVPPRLRRRQGTHNAAFDLRSSAPRFSPHSDLYGLRKDGTEFSAEIGLTHIADSEDGLILGVVVDVSERKRTERLKDEFVSTVSHELRTPLTSISGSLGLLTGIWADSMPAAAARLLAIAHKNSQRLVRLVNDILDIEKLESGHVIFDLGRVDVGALLVQTIESNRGYAEAYGVRLRLDTTGADAEVYADPDRLGQVITNLISNAIKFSPADDEVVVAFERDGDVVRISVRDHGRGIPPEFKPHIFEKFAQADASDTREKSGTGLGLSIVSQIVERLGGKVEFEDAVGGGTVFHVELPAWLSRQSWEIDPNTADARTRILLCEDDRSPRTSLREGLRSDGFATDFAFTKAAAIECVDGTTYAAILVDLQLPGGDPLTLVQRLRDQPQYRHTPIILVGLDVRRWRDDARAAALDILEWFAKPVDLGRLDLVIRAAIAVQPERLPRILHVAASRNVLTALTEALHLIADVVPADSIEGARRAIATDDFDLAILDVALGAGSGLELLPDLRGKDGEVTPVVTFSADDAGLSYDPHIESALGKAEASVEHLVKTVRAQLDALAIKKRRLP